MEPFPTAPGYDSTLNLWREGYAFGLRRFERLGCDAFRTRLMLRPVLFARGQEAARVFYEPDRFTRQGAMPPTTLRLLQDKGSVQGLDGPAHRWRKELFLRLLRPGHFEALGKQFEQTWREQWPHWEAARSLRLHDAFQSLLCQSTCAWAGISLRRKELPRRTREFAAMIDGAGGVGPRTWRALLLREQTERWARGHISKARAASLGRPPETPLETVASHRDEDGALLSKSVAAVELLNLLRPTVAVARYLTFVALALQQHPEAARRLRETADPEADLTVFAQEVRRFHPFFPLIAGRVREPFTWRGERFEEGRWMILDLYGTHHDPAVWEAPERFRPDRFAGDAHDPFSLIPQGGGDHAETHRCAGEWLTLDLMKRTARILSTELAYTVPSQNLRVNLGRMPALPKSRFRIRDVRVIESAMHSAH